MSRTGDHNRRKQSVKACVYDQSVTRLRSNIIYCVSHQWNYRKSPRHLHRGFIKVRHNALTNGNDGD